MTPTTPKRVTACPLLRRPHLRAQHFHPELLSTRLHLRAIGQLELHRAQVNALHLQLLQSRQRLLARRIQAGLELGHVHAQLFQGGHIGQGGAALGGDGMLIGPVYTVQGVRFGNVGGAVGALDGAVSALGTRVGLLESAAAPAPGPGTGAGGSGESGGQLPIGTGPGEGADAGGPGHGLVAAGTGKGAVAIGEGSIANDADTVSVGSTDNLRRITHVGSGTAASDAATVGQMQAGDAQTLASARTYTDSRFKEMDDRFVDLSQGVDQRLHQQDRRIDRQGAMSSAMMNMALNAAGSSVQRLSLVGGGARSTFWAQQLATALDVEIVTHGSSAVGGALGAARLGWLATGADMAAVCLTPEVDATYRPAPADQPLLLERYATFRSLYRTT